MRLAVFQAKTISQKLGSATMNKRASIYLSAAALALSPFLQSCAGSPDKRESEQQASEQQQASKQQASKQQASQNPESQKGGKQEAGTAPSRAANGGGSASQPSAAITDEGDLLRQLARAGVPINYCSCQLEQPAEEQQAGQASPATSASPAPGQAAGQSQEKPYTE